MCVCVCSVVCVCTCVREYESCSMSVFHRVEKSAGQAAGAVEQCVCA